jgi:hypothetical protein
MNSIEVETGDTAVRDRLRVRLTAAAWNREGDRKYL